MILKTILILCAVLISVVLVAIFLLPKERTATKTITFDHDCERVWGIYADPARQLEWRSDLKNVEMLNDTPPKAWVEVPHRGPAITFKETGSIPGERLTLTFTADGQFEGHHEAVFRPAENGCEGSFTEQVMLISPVAKLLSYIFFDLGEAIEKYGAEASDELHKQRQ